MALFLLITFFVLMAIGTPIGLAMGLTALFGFFALGDARLLTIVSQNFFSAMNSYVLVALPLFILAGDILNRSRLTDRLVAFSNVFFGKLRGGLGHVNIITSIIFGGMSGAAVADTAALGRIFIPAMTREGYGKAFSTAVTVSSSIIAPIIPPSIIMVIYGALMGVSIAGMFAAGIVPGFMVGASLMIVNGFISAKRGYPKLDQKFTFRGVISSTKQAAFALIMPIIILGGILSGVVTPTEAAGIAVGYALFIGLVVYRNIKLKDLYDIFFKTSIIMGKMGLIFCGAAILGWIMASEHIPEIMADFFISLSSNKYIILLLVNVFLLIIGMALDVLISLLILAPVLAPLAISLGVDPLHFGVMVCINLNIALLTPPVGACLNMAMAITDLELEEIIREVWPFLIAEIVVLFFVVYIPPVTMFMPRLLGFAG